MTAGKIRLCSLREYTASNGKHARAVWTAFLEQAEPRPSARQEPAQSPRASTPRYHPPAATQGGRQINAKRQKPRRRSAIQRCAR